MPAPKARQAVSRKTRNDGNRLASILADVATGDHGVGHPAGPRSAHRLLDRILAPALEVSGGSGRGPAYRAPPDRAGILRARRARPAQPAGPLVDRAYWPHAGLHFHRTGDWFDPL